MESNHRDFLDNQAGAARTDPLPRAGTGVHVSCVTEEAICRVSRARGPGDATAAWIATRQLGVITARQLVLAGLNPDAISRRHVKEQLHRIHRGVYLWGTPLALPGALELAAVLACGPSATVSHRSAGGLWGIADSSEQVEVTVYSGSSRAHPALVIHRVEHLSAPERPLLRGIPVTSPTRTLLDLAATVDTTALADALNEAYARKLTTERDLRRALDDHPKRRGTAALRRLLDDAGDEGYTRSEAEKALLALVTRAGLPRPALNRRLLGFRADALWAEQKLVAEFDGYTFHGHKLAFERDRARDRKLAAAGYRVIRITWHALRYEPMRVLVDLVRALGA